MENEEISEFLPGKGHPEDVQITRVKNDQWPQEASPSRPESHRTIQHTNLVSTIIVATFTFASLCICLWIVAHIRQSSASWTSSSLIGHGYGLTQTQAKFIDVISSSIIAPLIVGILNCYCFQTARSCAVNENTGLKQGIALQALVEFSTTDWGTYSPFKLYPLLRTRQLRIVLLAVIALLCAVGFSALSNVVAYEAFSQGGQPMTALCQYLYRPPDRNSNYYSVSSPQMPAFNTTGQQSKFSSQWFSTLTTVGYSPAAQFLDNGEYVGFNATNATLGILPTNTTDLLSVPAYKLSYQCQPLTPTNPSLNVLGSTTQALQIRFFAPSLQNSSSSSIWQSQIENGAAGIMGTDNGIFQFAAFPFRSDPSVVFLGNIATVYETANTSSPTEFGPVTHVTFNNTLSSYFPKAWPVLYMWGVACSFYRQEGTVDMYRESNTSLTTWTRTQGNFSDEKHNLTLITFDLQLQPPYVSPIGTLAGIGGATAASSNITCGFFSGTKVNEDFGTWASNFLYAEGEARRIAYEIALEVPSQEVASLDYIVEARGTTIKYHMMPLPWILVTGLLAIGLAGLIVLFLAFKGRGVPSSKLITPLRVLLDAKVGLETEAFEGKAGLEEKEIQKWAAHYRVKYVQIHDGYQGSTALRAAGIH